MKDPPVSLSKPKKMKSFSKEELVSSDLEETGGSRSLLKRKKYFPQKESVIALKRQEIGMSSRKRKNSLPKRTHSTVDLKRLLAPRVPAPRKRKISKSYTRKIRMDPGGG